MSISVDIYTKGNSQMIAVKDMEYTDGLAEMFFMENLKIIEVMAMAIKSLQLVMNTMVSTRMT